MTVNVSTPVLCVILSFHTLLLIYIAISDMQSPFTSYLQQIYSRFPSHITKQIWPMPNTAMLWFSCREILGN